MAQLYIPSTNVPLLTKDTIDTQIAQVRKGPTVVPELHYGPGESFSVEQFSASEVKVISGVEAKGLRYMWDPPERRREVINERIKHLGEHIHHHYHLDEFAKLTDVAQDERTYLGIVQSCGQASGSVTCVVDGYWSPDQSYGCNVTLLLDDVGQYSLFPGKIFAFKGKNLGGNMIDTILVSEIYDPVPLPVSSACRSAPMEEDLISRVMIISGPFTYDQVKTWNLINEMVLFAVRQRHASCVLLCGPFVPVPFDDVVDHAMMYDDQFYGICEQINSLADKYAGLKIVMVPSIKDVASDFVFPQPPYDVGFDGTGIIGTSNPATIMLNNDVTIGISTNPILEHMAHHFVEVNPNPDMGRISRMALQVLKAHSFYPMMPAAADAQLSYDHYHYCDFPGNCTPDVMILPSCLPPSAQKVGNSLLINPGFVSKRSFAELTIKPGNADTLVADRASVEFFKLSNKP